MLLADDLDRRYERLRALPIATLRKQALAEDPWAMVYLGIRRREGDGVDLDPAAAISFFRLAEAKGNVGAKVELAAAYLDGRGVEKDVAAAKARLQPLAQQGVARAQFLLASASEGEEAKSWLQQAAALGHEPARKRLAGAEAAAATHTPLVPAPPRSIEVQPAPPLVEPSAPAKPVPKITAVPAIPQGTDPLATVPLEQRWADFGTLMNSGAANAVNARGKLAEERGLLADALEQYAHVTMSPPGQSAQYAASVFALSRIVAIYASGRLSREQLESVRVPLPESPTHVISPVSRTQLGDLFWEGKVVARDPARAVEWYLRAAQAGGPVAMSRLGQLWREGLDKQPPDRAEAVRWFRQAAAQGHGPSQLELGRAYLQGDGVPANATLAAKWLRLAAQAKQPEAAPLLERAEAAQKVRAATPSPVSQ